MNQAYACSALVFHWGLSKAYPNFCYTPVAWKSIYNISNGAVFGSLGHNIMQMGYFRPHNRHDRYPNVYFTGGSTHPGNGVPLVLLSSKLTSERIIKEHSPEPRYQLSLEIIFNL